ncbi:OLC1v1022446C1 [Oldenlandia corymbosa var. corymbosa]|uniref:OLC1v1022446C1 n=1 Tax=Oldenlandia corymbosa var. corymbosa TaxID=529605 RepID=A0AAV1C1L0_OLDCO|nr:OLC1v1022446C1 [Oldenlandia corymbosa var. corymbosa]
MEMIKSIMTLFISLTIFIIIFRAEEINAQFGQQQQQQNQQNQQGQNQGQQPSYSSSPAANNCVQQLQPCLEYLDGNRDPPNSCCDPLRYVIKSEPECLCSMISIRGANQAERAGINLTNAQQLPARCGERINPLGCILGSNSSSSSGLTLWTVPSLIIMAAASWIFVL